MADDFTLLVTDGVLSERLVLEADVEDEDWFAPPGASPAEIEEGLNADADELLASEVAQVMRALDVRWPVCEDHGLLMEACSGWWYCNGEPNHDVAAVGSLQQA